MFVALSVPLQRRRRPPPLRAASSRRLTELRAHAEGVVMSRFLFSTSAIAAALLTSNPAVAEATEGEVDRDRPPDIIVTAQLEDRELQDLKTPALGVGSGGEQIAATNALNAEDVGRYEPALIRSEEQTSKLQSLTRI